VPKLEQVVRFGAGCQDWSKEPELEQGVSVGAGRRNWSRAIEGGAAGLQKTTILSTDKQREKNCITRNEVSS